MWPRRLRLERHRERHALLFNIFSINNPRGFVNITDVTRAAGRVKPRGYAERPSARRQRRRETRWQTNRTETATEERRRYAVRHDEREAIALIRESNRNIYEQPDVRTAVWVCRATVVIPRDRAAFVRSFRSRERVRVIEFATFGVT